MISFVFYCPGLSLRGTITDIITGADPGFLERGFMGKRCGIRFIFLKYPMKMKYKSLYFHGIFKNGGGGGGGGGRAGGGSSEPPLVPPLINIR